MLFHLAPCVAQVRQTSENIGRGDDVVGKDITNERPEMDYNHSQWGGGAGSQWGMACFHATSVIGF